jgi:hypothetical protein
MKIRTEWLNLLDQDQKGFFVKSNHAQQHWRAQLDPLLRDYINPLNGFFVSSVQNMKELEQRPLWLARDGVIPLLFFFNKFKHPKNLKSKILIREDLLTCVPVNWRAHIGSFNIVSVEKKEPKSIFIYGMNSEALVSVESSDEALQDILALQINQLEKVLLYLPSRRFSAKESEHEAAEVLQSIFKKVSLNAEIVDWADVLPHHDWKSTLIVNIQKNTVVSDDWLFHTLLSRGAFVSSAKDKSKDEFVYFSPFHGCSFNLKPHWPKVSPKEYDNYLRLQMGKIEMSTFDWFQIFAGK